MTYSPSQINPASEVDPVAEADVYQAYGRDQQAEEILKEALRTQPDRLAVHSKLLEIHAKRRDIKAFENGALVAFKLTAGQGPEWSYIGQMGRELEPDNSLYQSGGLSESLPAKSNFGMASPSNTIPQALTGLAPVANASQGPDLDLDLDADFASGKAFSASTVPAPLTAGTLTYPGSKAEPVADPAMPSAFLDLDFNLDDMAAPAPATPTHEAASAELPSSDLDFMANSLDFTSEPFIAPKAAISPPAPVSRGAMLEFDLDLLSLDLTPAVNEDDKNPAQGSTDQEKDPLEIKFLLAEEFRLLGDSDGARSLAGEVVAHAKGPLKFKAQAFLNTLS